MEQYQDKHFLMRGLNWNQTKDIDGQTLDFVRLIQYLCSEVQIHKCSGICIG